MAAGAKSLEMDNKTKPLEDSAKVNAASAVRPDWQIGCSELKQRGGHLLQTGQWSDCSFLVGEDSEQVTIKAHRLILASASPVFEAMLFGGMAEGDGPIRILDVHPSAFRTLLIYIYTDRTIIPSFDKACSVYYAAKKYMLPYLEKECTWFISLNLDVTNVCRAFELAQLFDEPLLMEKCLKVMEENTKAVVNDNSFLEASVSVLNTILSLNHLSIESELDLFSAVERYAKAHLKTGPLKRRSEVGLDCTCDCSMKRIRLSSYGNETLTSSDKTLIAKPGSRENSNHDKNMMERHEETGELVPSIVDKTQPCASTPMNLASDKSDNVQSEVAMEDGDTARDDASTVSCLSKNDDMNSSQMLQDSCEDIDRNSLREAIGKIRFLTLSAAQFAAGPARSPLLSESEAFAVLMNILSSAADVPMPSGFSDSKLPRNQQTLAQECAEAPSEAVFRFTVLNFKTRRRSVTSRPFPLLDAPWTLRLVPRFEFDTGCYDDKYFGVYLKCVASKETKFSFDVKAEIRLLAHQPMKPDVITTIRKVFTNSEPEWGVDRLVGWEDVLRPERALLRHNAVTLEVRVSAKEKPT